MVVGRVTISLLVGLLASGMTLLKMGQKDRAIGRNVAGVDFTYWYRAAHALEAGQNPYQVIGPERPVKMRGVFAYPLPAALVTLPLTPFSPRVGAAVFVGLGFAVAAFGLLASGYWRLIVLLSAPATAVFANGQWSPLLLGASLIPTLGFLLACKPLGAALFLYRPSWRAGLGIVALGILSIFVLPSWPLDWIETIRHHPMGSQYHPPLLMPGGFLLLLAAFSWRTPEGRLLLAMACIPQNAAFYDQLPLMLIPTTRKALIGYALWTQVVYVGSELIVKTATVGQWEPVIMASLYLPALAMVLFSRAKTEKAGRLSEREPGPVTPELVESAR
jgi:hypothetical protein